MKPLMADTGESANKRAHWATLSYVFVRIHTKYIVQIYICHVNPFPSFNNHLLLALLLGCYCLIGPNSGGWPYLTVYINMHTYLYIYICIFRYGNILTFNMIIDRRCQQRPFMRNSAGISSVHPVWDPDICIWSASLMAGALFWNLPPITIYLFN